MKLVELNIVRDGMISPEDERKYNEKMITLIGETYQEDKSLIMEAFVTFFAKVYLNYNFESILKNANLDIGDLTRYINDKPYKVLSEVQYMCPLVTRKTVDRILGAIKDKVIYLLKSFHHDFLFNTETVEQVNNGWVCLSQEDIQAMKESEARMNKYVNIYNTVVLGTKLIFKKD